LAFIGDTVFELMVRETLLANVSINTLHNNVKSLVMARAQSHMVEKILPLLTEEETLAYKRGRNATSHTSPKNTDIADYRRATGLEALFGYLYLKGETERMNELFKICVGDENIYVK